MNPILLNPMPAVVNIPTDASSPTAPEHADGTFRAGHRHHEPYAFPQSRLPLPTRRPPPKRRPVRHGMSHADEENHEDLVIATQIAENISIKHLSSAWKQAPSTNTSSDQQGQSDGGTSAAPWHALPRHDELDVGARRQGAVRDRASDAQASRPETPKPGHQPAAAIVPNLQSVAQGFIDIVHRKHGDDVLALLHRWMAQHIAAGHHPDASSHALEDVLDALAAACAPGSDSQPIRPETAALLPLMVLVTMRRRAPRDASRAADRLGLLQPRPELVAVR